MTSPRLSRRFLAVVCLAIAAAFALPAQDQAAGGTPAADQAARDKALKEQQAKEHPPQPYEDSEFPAWARDLWRAEAVAVGSFPLTLFATLEVYDTIRYVLNGFDPGYAPWPIGSSGATVPYTKEETAWLAVSAVSLSVIVAGIDFVLGRLAAAAP